MIATDMTTMLRAVLINPFDMLARLAYADSLEEAGNLGEADMVRFRVAQWDSFPEGVSAHWNDIDWLGWCGQHNRAGLVESIRCTCSDFLIHAEALFRAHPITRVTFTDKVPSAGDAAGNWEWWNYSSGQLSRHAIPGRLFPILLGRLVSPALRGLRCVSYPTEAAALDALSQACIAYGRNLAGLPPLLTEQPIIKG